MWQISVSDSSAAGSSAQGIPSAGVPVPGVGSGGGLSPPPPGVHSLITTYSKYTEFTEAFTFILTVPNKSLAGTENTNAVVLVEHPVIFASVWDSHNN